MAPKVRIEQRHPELPSGYSWATDGTTDGTTDEKQSSPKAKNVHLVRLHSSLVFEMPKPEDWDQLALDSKFQKKREYLCQQWGEENFAFLEDDLDTRKFNGRISVRRKDYYTRFEAWDAEHFAVQYHNTMTLLDQGLKMSDEEFSNLKARLGVSDAELLHALQDELGVVNSPTVSVIESRSARMTANRGNKRNHSKVDVSSVQSNSPTDKSQKPPAPSPQKRAKIQKAEKPSTKPVRLQYAPITPPYEPTDVRRRLCKAKIYGRGLRENQHKHADNEKLRFAELGEVFSKLEKAAKAAGSTGTEGDGVRKMVTHLFIFVKTIYPNSRRISDYNSFTSLHWYWAIYNEYIKSISGSDLLAKAAVRDLHDLDYRGMLGRGEEHVRSTEIRQHCHQMYHNQWQTIVNDAFNVTTSECCRDLGDGPQWN